jgi:hypothetical protein
LRALLVVALACGALVTASSGAQAIIPCPLEEPCLFANDDFYATNFETELRVTAANGVLVNDEGPQATRITIDESEDVSLMGGDVVWNASGAFVYTPPEDYSGLDYISYVIQDRANLDEANQADGVVEVTVKPIVRNDAYTTLRNKPLIVGPAQGVFANDAGVDPSLNYFYPDFTTKGGALSVNEDGSFEYTPPPNFTGTDTFVYEVSDINFDADWPGTATIQVNPPTPPPPPKPKGYWMVGQSGTVYPFGQVQNWGNANSLGVVDIEPTPSKKGYWIANAFGQVFRFGDAKSLGNAGTLRRNEFVSSISSTPTGNGYWLFTNRGRVFHKGDAKFFGDMRNVALNGPVVGSVATPSGKGYYMVGSDGGIFAFGDAKFYGSMGGQPLNKPVNGIVPDGDGKGYWLVASDGGIFAFQAPFRGSMGGKPLNKPIIGMVRYGNGYLMVSSDGGIFSFSNLPFFGSLGANPPAIPISSVAAGG